VKANKPHFISFGKDSASTFLQCLSLMNFKMNLQVFQCYNKVETRLESFLPFLGFASKSAEYY
jgi:hypothetical protein